VQILSKRVLNGPSTVLSDPVPELAPFRAQTDYEVKVKSDGSFLRRKWRVERKTQIDPLRKNGTIAA
jgi:hypothetical protein